MSTQQNTSVLVGCQCWWAVSVGVGGLSVLVGCQCNFHLASRLSPMLVVMKQPYRPTASSHRWLHYGEATEVRNQEGSPTAREPLRPFNNLQGTKSGTQTREQAWKEIHPQSSLQMGPRPWQTPRLQPWVMPKQWTRRVMLDSQHTEMVRLFLLCCFKPLGLWPFIT